MHLWQKPSTDVAKSPPSNAFWPSAHTSAQQALCLAPDSTQDQNSSESHASLFTAAQTSNEVVRTVRMPTSAQKTLIA